MNAFTTDPSSYRYRRRVPDPNRGRRAPGLGAALAEQHHEWAGQRRYMGLEILAQARVHSVDAEATPQVTPAAITA
jgi:putative transposase